MYKMYHGYWYHIKKDYISQLGDAINKGEYLKNFFYIVYTWEIE